MTHSTKHIWIIGASSGMGRALSIHFAECGHDVLASARRVEVLQALSSQYSRITPLSFDVSSKDTDQTEQFLKQSDKPIDMLVYCAGICDYEDGLTLDPRMYERVMATNFFGLVRALKLALPFLSLSKKKPQIVVIGSLSSIVGLSRAEAYGASKAAIDYFVESVRTDVAHLNIGVTLIRPGFVSTELVRKNDFPMPFIMSEEDATRRIIKAIERRKLSYNFPKRLSVWLYVYRIFYPWVYRVVARKMKRNTVSRSPP